MSTEFMKMLDKKCGSEKWRYQSLGNLKINEIICTRREDGEKKMSKKHVKLVSTQERNDGNENK